MMTQSKASNDERPPTGEMVATVRIPTTPERLEEIIATLRSVVGPTLANSSCKECSVVADVIEVRYVVFRERWTSFQAFERHARSKLYQRVLVALDMASEPPEVRFECMGRTWGLDLLKDLSN